MGRVYLGAGIALDYTSIRPLSPDNSLHQRGNGSDVNILMTHPSAELYGSDRMLLITAAALARRGHMVTVVVPTEGPLVGKLEAAGAKVYIADVPVLRKSDMKPVRLIRMLWSVLRSQIPIRHIFQAAKPDVVYTNTIVQPWWILAAKMHFKPCVVHVREAENNVSKIITIGLSLPLLCGNIIVCNSRATRAQLPFLSRVRKDIRVVYNGKDWSAYGGARDYLTEAFARTARLVVIGRLSPRKGQDVAIRALSVLVANGYDAELTLVGDVFPGYEWFEQELVELCAGLGLTDRVAFAGFRDDIRPALARTDIAIVPSRVEPFGTVAAEAMAAGVFTVAADVQGLAEVVQDGVSGVLFPVGNSRALADRCAWAIDNQDKAARLAKQGADEVGKRFTLESYERNIVEVLEGPWSQRRPKAT